MKYLQGWKVVRYIYNADAEVVAEIDYSAVYLEKELAQRKLETMKETHKGYSLFLIDVTVITESDSYKCEEI